MEIYELELIGGEVVEYVKIDRGNDEFSTMPKSVWDAQQDAETL